MDVVPFSISGLRALVAVLIAAVTGHIVMKLIVSIRRRRLERQRVAMLRMRLRAMLLGAFADARRVRKLSRQVMELSDATTGEPRFISTERCRASLESLQEVSAGLACFAAEISLHREVFVEGESAHRSAATMKKYVDKVIHELAAHRNFPVALDTCPFFSDLTGEYRQSRYRSRFVRSFYNALSDLQSV